MTLTRNATRRSSHKTPKPSARNGQLLRAGIEDEVGQLAVAQGFGNGLDPDGAVASIFGDMPRRRIVARATNQDRLSQAGLFGVLRHEPDSLGHNAPTAGVGMCPISNLGSFR